MSLSLSKPLRRWTREIRPTVVLSIPIVAGMVSQTLMGLTDTIMVGQVGAVPLAASAFVNAIAHLPLVFFLGLLSAVSVLGSQAYGARRNHEAGEVLRHGLVLAFLAGAATTLGLIALRPFLFLFGQAPNVTAASGSYLILFGASLWPALVAQGCKHYSEALNRPWIPTYIFLGGVLLNVFLNWILIYGHWGAPAMGLNGAGWATLIARLTIAITLMVYMVRAKVFHDWRPARWWARLDLPRLARMLKLGLPVAFQHLMEVSAFVFAALMMGWISANALAAHQIAITCAATTFMFTLGIGMAVSIRVGHAYGAQQFHRMRRIGFVGLSLGTVCMGLFAVMFVIWRQPIAVLFVSSAPVINLAAQLLLIAAVFQIADGVQIVAISALRGLSDVRIPAWVAVFAYWVVAVPLAYGLAFPAGYGPPGVWAGLAVGLGTAAGCLTWRFHRLTKNPKPRARPTVPYPLAPDLVR